MFTKCGVIKEGDDKMPRVKIYRDKALGDVAKGDGLITYLKEPSVRPSLLMCLCASVHLSWQLLHAVMQVDLGSRHLLGHKAGTGCRRTELDQTEPMQPSACIFIPANHQASDQHHHLWSKSQLAHRSQLACHCGALLLMADCAVPGCAGGPGMQDTGRRAAQARDGHSHDCAAGQV